MEKRISRRKVIIGLTSASAATAVPGCVDEEQIRPGENGDEPVDETTQESESENQTDMTIEELLEKYGIQFENKDIDEFVPEEFDADIRQQYNQLETGYSYFDADFFNTVTSAEATIDGEQNPEHISNFTTNLANNFREMSPIDTVHPLEELPGVSFREDEERYIEEELFLEERWTLKGDVLIIHHTMVGEVLHDTHDTMISLFDVEEETIEEVNNADRLQFEEERGGFEIYSANRASMDGDTLTVEPEDYDKSYIALSQNEGAILSPTYDIMTLVIDNIGSEMSLPDTQTFTEPTQNLDSIGVFTYSGYGPELQTTSSKAISQIEEGEFTTVKAVQSRTEAPLTESGDEKITDNGEVLVDEDDMFVVSETNQFVNSLDE